MHLNIVGKLFTITMHENQYLTLNRSFFLENSEDFLSAVGQGSLCLACIYVSERCGDLWVVKCKILDIKTVNEILRSMAPVHVIIQQCTSLLTFYGKKKSRDNFIC